MSKPKLIVNGKEYTIARPTMKMWRIVAEYDDMDKSEWTWAKLMTEHAKMLGEIYGVDADEIDPSDVIPGYVEAATYVINLANEKLKKLPNVETETEE